MAAATALLLLLALTTHAQELGGSERACVEGIPGPVRAPMQQLLMDTLCGRAARRQQRAARALPCMPPSMAQHKHH